MPEGTRPPDHPAPVSDPGADPLEAWARGLCPDDVLAELHELQVEGNLVLRWLATWTRAVDATVTRYEVALRTHPLNDDLHRELAAAAGVDRLYALADQLLDAASVA